MIDMSIQSKLPCMMLLCDGDVDIGKVICSKFLTLRYRVILAGAQIGNASWISGILEEGGDVQILQSCGKAEDVAGHMDGIAEELFVNVLVHIVGAGDDSEISEALMKTITHSMVTRGFGRVIYIAAGRKGLANSSGKSFESEARTLLGAMTEEIRQSPVTVNTITLGCTDNAITSQQIHTIDSRKVCRADIVKLEEIAGLTAYLASDEATGIDGAVIAINMGRYLS
ncbi:hypothetical protein [Oxalicibacterium solurbis]|uniref:SDR family oxidoreductase n=1 Tax=Oxalicibacterium solurbis TaxID=69280 RepID=A0A8J3AVC1_9BURK|nr:hypothetical protein [Oxalicibacterium solurbis]GGI53920.1 hypothetical protein GCM10011430_10940 [Oxalicibacterium solurbis]